MNLISEFAGKRKLPVEKVRREIEKALNRTALRGLGDAEFMVETLVFMIAKELKKHRRR